MSPAPVFETLPASSTKSHPFASQTPPNRSKRIACGCSPKSSTVGKRLVETGHVRVRTIVEEEPVVLRDEARRQSVEIERAPIGRVVDQAPAVREEGDVIVIPIVEERLVVVKQLFLVEEVRIRRASITEPVEIAATRRVMRAGIDRTPIQSPTRGRPMTDPIDPKNDRGAPPREVHVSPKRSNWLMWLLLGLAALLLLLMLGLCHRRTPAPVPAPAPVAVAAPPAAAPEAEPAGTGASGPTSPGPNPRHGPSSSNSCTSTRTRAPFALAIFPRFRPLPTR